MASTGDRTARRAIKSIASSGLTDTISINGGEAVRISRATAKVVFDILDMQYAPSTGTYFAALKENAAAILADHDGNDQNTNR